MPPTRSTNPAAPRPTGSPLEVLQRRLGTGWAHIEDAARRAAERRSDLEKVLEGISLSADTGLLVFGSLARDEWTMGSDVDWTLLIDGQADPSHFRVAQSIADRFEDAKIKKPGRTGVFGGLAFSHQLVHHIGGEPDTNLNTTRRILLLLESRSIGESVAGQPDDVRDRVIRAVVNRYLEDDPSLGGETNRVPRFLLNDIVRFWRTMAVDYASKRRERGDQGWAIRNVKLRFSRKLVFVAGLLACFKPAIDPTASQSPNGAGMVQYLRSVIEEPPLQILAAAAHEYCDDDTAGKMFGAYDEFLALLDNPAKRAHLEQLTSVESHSDALFQSMRLVSRQFQESLSTLFFACDSTLTHLSMEYGLF